jgi:hypothetical protein
LKAVLLVFQSPEHVIKLKFHYCSGLRWLILQLIFHSLIFH